MGQLIASKILGAITGLFSGLDAIDVALLRNILSRQKAREIINDAATAGTAVGEKTFFQNTTGTNLRIIQIALVVPVAVTADNANNATITVFSRTSAGASQATVAALTTNIAQGSLVAQAPVTLTVTAANSILAPGSVLTVSVTKAGTGVALTSATAQASVEALLEPTD